jgi:hypothetical protein
MIRNRHCEIVIPQSKGLDDGGGGGGGIELNKWITWLIAIKVGFKITCFMIGVISLHV